MLARETIKRASLPPGTKLKGVWGESAPDLETLPFRRAKMAVQCISAGKVTGPITVALLFSLVLFSGCHLGFLVKSCDVLCLILSYSGIRPISLSIVLISSNIRSREIYITITI